MLLDLPDHDSTEMAHRLEVDRLVALVDVLVWVLDPQKYADAAVHDRYLRPLARHGDVMVVVLNQVDRLAAADVPDAVADVRRLLARRRPARRAGAARVGDRRDRAGPAARRADRRGHGAPGGACGGSPPTSTPSAPASRTSSAVPPATTSTAARSAHSSPPSGRRPGSPPWARRCSARPCTGPSRRRASRSPAGCAACGRTRCAGCTSTGPARRPSRPDPTTPTSWRPRSGRPCPPPVRWSGRGWTWRCAGSPTTPPRACPTRGRTRCATPPGRARATWPTRWTGPSPPRISG